MRGKPRYIREGHPGSREDAGVLGSHPGPRDIGIKGAERPTLSHFPASSRTRRTSPAIVPVAVPACHTHINNNTHPRQPHRQPFNHKYSTRRQRHNTTPLLHTSTNIYPYHNMPVPIRNNNYTQPQQPVLQQHLDTFSHSGYPFLSTQPQSTPLYHQQHYVPPRFQ
ncbi:hypothetical protein Pcinc_004871 [Petrolisthes cinctipes]|uniref:Uncharacterized protein n=1 Tax=Petrolisthes cinctipes TaxID=88211 RepID=A0AAE1GGD1_PETCI|nr:hypothetical protein Pcinc_004871 [Petrolisthes cinctipes]